MRAAPAKFLFDDDFAAKSGERKAVHLGHRARRKGQGGRGCRLRPRLFRSARPQPNRTPQARAAAALERIAAQLAGLDRALAAVEAKLETEAVEVAVAVAAEACAGAGRTRTACGNLGAGDRLLPPSGRHPACGRARQRHAARRSAREQLDDIVQRCGLNSRLVVLAEPDIAPGDCRIEWADGGITRDSAATAAAIDDAVARYVDARTGTATTIPEIAWS